MSRLPAAAYGTDVRCILDADALFSAATGLDIVKQDALHRLLTDDVLGPGGDGWGFDCRRLLGASASVLRQTQPVLANVLLRDERLATADVTLTKTTTTAGLPDVLLAVRCTTAAGPSFDFVVSVANIATALAAQGAT